LHNLIFLFLDSLLFTFLCID